MKMMKSYSYIYIKKNQKNINIKYIKIQMIY
jgi:hypothetical protein